MRYSQKISLFISFVVELRGLRPYRTIAFESCDESRNRHMSIFFALRRTPMTCSCALTLWFSSSLLSCNPHSWEINMPDKRNFLSFQTKQVLFRVRPLVFPCSLPTDRLDLDKICTSCKRHCCTVDASSRDICWYYCSCLCLSIPLLPLLHKRRTL